jgi:excisionase family DNA binding protein
MENINKVSKFSGTTIHLGRILDSEYARGLTQDETDELIKLLILYKNPENIDKYLSNLKVAVMSLFDKLLISIIDFKIKNNSFIEEIKEVKEKEKDEATLTIEGVCHRMKISRPTIYSWFDKGLKKFNVGKRVYIYKKDLDEFLEENSIS